LIEFSAPTGSRFIGQALGRLGYYLEIAQNRVLGLGVGQKGFLAFSRVTVDPICALSDMNEVETIALGQRGTASSTTSSRMTWWRASGSMT